MKYKITLNGKTYEVEVEEGQAMLVDEYEAYKPAAPAAAPAPAPAAAPAPKAAPAAGAQSVTAPMPGTVLDVKVAPGQAVGNGEVLIILEAMKMENEIVAPAAGTVDTIPVSKGDAVNTGDVLVTLV